MRRLLLFLTALAVALVTVAAPAPTPAKPSIVVAGPAPVSTSSGSTSPLGPASEPALRYLIAARQAEVDRWNAGLAAGEAARAAAETPPPAPKPKTPAKPSPAPRTASTGSTSTSSTGSVNGWPCGGDLPPCSVLRRESGGNPTAYNPTGCSGRSCGGLWQFDPRTWAGFGGYSEAQNAPGEIQNERARQVWRGGAGCSNWGAC